MGNSLHPAVVLVADRTLSADYRVLFEGIFATTQTRRTPALVMRTLLAPRMSVHPDGQAKATTLGLRRIEATLLDGGTLKPSDLAVATPETLSRLVGPWTKIVAVASGDPLGMGQSNTTMSQIRRAELYTKRWMDRLMLRIQLAKGRFGFQLLAGGGGAWQYAQNPQAAADHGIDCVFEGYFETLGPALIANLLSGRPAPSHVREAGTAIGAVRPIRAASLMGSVELSRGCGRGCPFCTSASRPMEHLPSETILADLRTNVAAGVTSAIAGSEDFFRYGGAGEKVNFEALRSLLEQVRGVKGLRFVQLENANISSVLQYAPEELSEVRRLLALEAPSDYLWINMGVETASPELLRRVSPAKAAPFRLEDWPELVLQAAERMEKAGFFSMFSLVMGLPGETPADVEATLALVRKLALRRAAVFPVFHEPVLSDARARGEAFGPHRMSELHVQLVRECYEINCRQMPGLFWDNQRAGGVGWLKRAVLQAMGRCEVFLWRRAFSRMGGQCSVVSGQ